ncbi:MAG TPA: molybdopterin converting factor subunit 1 [Alphaproteobacteria bacterium]|nr:molybdopterin converting factor subunit 1 [Alphaproteobacteria bacterium]MDP6271544.1 molybdopterin converting factor subunit 1 [Alphaproteobacteria bacterium]MDP7428494.1 molybdopterin converting factor subunit 1 [Alphaproteobacteria bacterium]HJM51463.1 molybdopterin converting factor subunit 1 [Alphaproteobacteria bacterium]
MKLLYFAWLRTRIGIAQESVVLPAEVTTVRQLVAWLASRGPAYAEALADPRVVRVAVNEEYARDDDAVSDGDEVALFPPVTGGGTRP